MAQMSFHGRDWCHICGQRRERLADVWYPRNAEHGGRDTEYIRVCCQCAEWIQKVCEGNLHGFVDPTSAPPPEGSHQASGDGSRA